MTNCPAWVARGLPLMLVVAALAGCSSPPASKAPERPAPAAPDPVDIERRALVRFELATAYYTQGQYDTALAELNRSLASNPRFGPAYNLRGLIHGALGDDALAEQAFQRALEINPRDPDTMHNYGWFLCQRKRFPEAIQQFNQALPQPQYRDVPRTLTARGLCQASAGLWAEAEASLMRSFELDPSNPITSFNLSTVLLRRGELARARFYIARVNAVPDATNAQTLWLEARIEHKLGNASAARQLGERLRARFPKAPELVLFDQGKFDE